MSFDDFSPDQQKQIFSWVNTYFPRGCLICHRGTFSDPSILYAPSDFDEDFSDHPTAITLHCTNCGYIIQIDYLTLLKFF